MTDPAQPGDRRPTGARRELERAPGERYRPSPSRGGDGTTGGETGSTARAVGLGTLTAIAGALLIVVLGGVLAMSVGLVVAAGLVGWLVGAVVTPSASAQSTRRFRRTIAAVLAVDAVVLAQVGLWLFARAEGGALQLVDYLAQTWGPLVPLQLLVAAAVAWWTTR
jgi:hypothetical protein